MYDYEYAMQYVVLTDVASAFSTPATPRTFFRYHELAVPGAGIGHHCMANAYMPSFPGVEATEMSNLPT
ncbi:hypothetical protein G7K_1270-t1 [Saitoella complicata NRRL Y-17804]|uniref:Uncharacterized protein n=1 Tax=Saitoella complicata (strain BCRC 22490 / CBS 7301 / JCM 7358 / NBRC 10748 / NRRL Y-17804) TaxID=698492 RepID=A0A0E9NB79_SAICN|nr:hypothetical protein G7K_1270-t1 [Saitoella complicata NRRL Y-17804]